MTSVLRNVAVLAVLILMSSSALRAQSDADWELLVSAPAGATGTTQTLTVPSTAPHVRAIRLVVKGGQVALDRVTVTYTNGQVHYESQPITLVAGGAQAKSAPINERDEGLLVESVALHFSGGTASRTPPTVEVWGLKPDIASRRTATRKITPAPHSETAPNSLPASAPQEKHFTEVPLFFGTTRERAPDKATNGRTIVTFSGVQGKELLLGRATVTIPEKREAGQIVTPRTIPILNISLSKEDPNQHFMVAAVDLLRPDQFVDEMRAKVAASKRFKNQAFVFVHGYNVNFDDALFRTAQIAYDMGFDGPAVTYSWPAGGRLLNYQRDSDIAGTSDKELRALLEMIAAKTGVTSVNIVAHSMGNGPLLSVLHQQADFIARNAVTVDLKLNEIVFAAPDVSRNQFQELATGVGTIVKGGLTLYASRNDLALQLSKNLFARLARAGDIPTEGIVVVPGVESIDVSQTSTSVFKLNHSDFGDRPHLITDMQLMFERQTQKHPPDVRFPVYHTMGSQPNRWWQYLR
jgi:esterase/lipase superfamily enzyme